MSNIIRGQKINRQKQAFAKKLRTKMTDYEKILWKRLKNKQACCLFPPSLRSEQGKGE
ncbi:MAG: DUF559 domain-containing protein [Spirochaetes bacterium]|nr:DUF559 domain-containing protein [Spirochaetota bacterium]